MLRLLSTPFRSKFQDSLVHSPKPFLDYRGGPPQKTHVLELELRGRFAISALDNLIIVHHQTSQTSLLFDICLGSFRTDGSVSVHTALVPPYSIKPFALKDTATSELCKILLDFIFRGSKLNHLHLYQIPRTGKFCSQT